MSCGCLKKKTESEYAKIKEMALRESELEKADYVIYSEGGRVYYDRRSCWEKAGRPGRVREFLFAL